MLDFITFFMLAIGLSFDTFAVSVSSGLVMKEITFYNAMKIAFSLAFFQALMPILGWLAGYSIRNYISAYDHWIAFILLTFLGFKMIYESLRREEEEKNFNPLQISMLLTMSLATSIDALIVGFGFSFIASRMIYPVFIIGAVTFIVSMLGILFGKKTGSHLGKKMEILGGIILFGIGLKILIQHIYF